MKTLIYIILSILLVISPYAKGLFFTRLSQVIVDIFFCHFFKSEFNTPGNTLGT